MGWLDDWLKELGPAPAPLPNVAHALPAKPRPEIKSIFATVHLPRDGDCGQITTGHYFVTDGVVTMCDESGKPTGKRLRLEPGDNERVIASRLTLEAWRAATPDFNRRLDYPTWGVA